MKTNAVRILEKHGVAYELREYDVDESDLSGLTVAEKIGLSPSQVFKTLISRGTSGSILLACIPTDRELDMKALAVAADEKKTELVPVREINRLTGYIRGGVSPVGTKKSYPVYLDEHAWTVPFISLSAGVRGCQMFVAAQDLAKVVEIRRCAITR